MIIEVEKLVFDFLVEKLKDKKVTVYHGLLPEINHEDREEGKSEKDLFPFAILRVTKFEQTRNGIDNYDVPVDLEDANRTLDKRAAENLNIIRKWCLSILKMVEIFRPKLSMKKKRFAISMNPSEFLEQVLDFLKKLFLSKGEYNISYVRPVVKPPLIDIPFFNCYI